MRDRYLFLRPGDALLFDNPRREITRKKLIGLEYGAKLDVARTCVTLGGGGINSATTFARLGFSTAPAVSLGDDQDAREIIAHCKKERIATPLIATRQNSMTGFSILIVAGEDQHDRVVLVDRGANDQLSLARKKSALNRARCIYTTSLSGPDSRDTLKTIAKAALAHTVLWAWNPGAEQLESGVAALGALMKNCGVFIVNRDEALGLLAAGGNSARDDERSLLAGLLRWGPRRVVITDGARGAYYADANQMLCIKPNSAVRAVERTGAGDAFGSGFIAGLLYTKLENIPYALQLGVCNAEHVIQAVGPHEGILKKSVVAKLMSAKQYAVRRLR